ncbi:hypothetical protein RUM43_012360 [Polyplax serrata]|uniref:Uncharacterized protein n=1 Tax=Polyplax serrata TaxID=468196 RepID=A0AAN8RSW6_POLSC
MTGKPNFLFNGAAEKVFHVRVHDSNLSTSTFKFETVFQKLVNRATRTTSSVKDDSSPSQAGSPVRPPLDAVGSSPRGFGSSGTFASKSMLVPDPLCPCLFPFPLGQLMSVSNRPFVSAVPIVLIIRKAPIKILCENPSVFYGSEVEESVKRSEGSRSTQKRSEIFEHLLI